LWGLAILALVIAMLALRRASKTAADVSRLSREHYYTESKLKRIPEEIQDAVRPLRLHLAGVAVGKTVSPEMIRDGRLYQDVSAEEVHRLLQHAEPGKTVLIDVRTPKEFAVRRLAGAKLVPIDELEARYREEIPESAEKVIVYCQGGDRSRFACDFLGRQGYTNLYNVRDGILGWPGPTEGEGEITFVQIERKLRGTNPAP
jgi:rhodanese-related sulfurtransferase